MFCSFFYLITKAIMQQLLIFLVGLVVTASISGMQELSYPKKVTFVLAQGHKIEVEKPQHIMRMSKFLKGMLEESTQEVEEVPLADFVVEENLKDLLQCVEVVSDNKPELVAKKLQEQDVPKVKDMCELADYFAIEPVLKLTVDDLAKRVCSGNKLKKTVLEQYKDLSSDLQRLITRTVFDNDQIIARPCAMQLLQERDNFVLTVQELRDGKLASTSFDTIKIWDRDSGTCVQILQGHTDMLYAVLELRDGNLASCSGDKTIKIWNRDGGTCLQTLQGHRGGVLEVIELRDGNLASCSKDGTIKIWNKGTGKCLQTLQGHRDSVYKVIELRDGLLASYCGHDTINIWDRSSGVCVQSLWGHHGYRIQLVELSDGSLVSTYGNDSIKIWDKKVFLGITVEELTNLKCYKDIVQENESSCTIM